MRIPPIEERNYSIWDDRPTLVPMSTDHQPPSSLPNAGKPWLDSDVLFLRIALKRGMSVVAVAGLLGRDEDEVRRKVEELQTDRD
jgi:hypothetical protein